MLIYHQKLQNDGNATTFRKTYDEALGKFLRFVTSMKDEEAYQQLYSELKELTRNARRRRCLRTSATDEGVDNTAEASNLPNTEVPHDTEVADTPNPSQAPSDLPMADDDADTPQPTD